ncbi:MAG TPA: hypothetical protein VJB15_06885 [Rhodothermia bacterium]|nr:hypothetical protein [Rhodothermia bacterium]
MLQKLSVATLATEFALRFLQASEGEKNARVAPQSKKRNLSVCHVDVAFRGIEAVGLPPGRVRRIRRYLAATASPAPRSARAFLFAALPRRDAGQAGECAGAGVGQLQVIGTWCGREDRVQPHSFTHVCKMRM